MKCNFHVGQKVVCVGDDLASVPEGYVLLTPLVLPVKGKIYTVRSIEIGLVRGEACLRLEEIEDQTAEVLAEGELWEIEIVFDASYFRPLVERKTDISVFKEMLNYQPKVVVLSW